MKWFIFILLLFPSLAFGQQFLWSTMDTDSMNNKYGKRIPLENVTANVIELYNLYDYYFDGSGFSKNNFIKTFDNHQDFKVFEELLHSIEQPTVLAVKTNNGRGSVISVLNIGKENIDMISFSNHILNRGFIGTSTYDKDKFIKWINTFLPTYSSQEIHTDRPISSLLTTANRRFVVPPKIDDSGTNNGIIAVEFRVDQSGKVTYARAGAKGSTISDRTLLEKCERALLDAELNHDENAPESQTGTIMFNFRER